MSLEKEVTLRALGAEIVRTPTEAPSESPESNIGVAKRLRDIIPGGVVLDQYNNPNNPEAHEFGTGREIVEQVTTASTTASAGRTSSGKVDVFIAGAGTGGTLTGCSRAIKKHNPASLVVAIDPVSIFSVFSDHFYFYFFSYSFPSLFDFFRSRQTSTGRYLSFSICYLPLYPALFCSPFISPFPLYVLLGTKSLSAPPRFEFRKAVSLLVPRALTSSHLVNHPPMSLKV